MDGNGAITAAAAGTATITAASAGLTAQVDVVVAGPGTQLHRVDSSTAPGSGQWVSYNQDNKYPFFAVSGGGWWSDSWAWMYTGVGDSQDYVDFTFTGNSVAVFLSNLNIGGKASIYLDGALQETVDTYRNIDTIQRDGTVFLKTGLSDGAHTVRVQTAGKSITGNAYDLINAFAYATGDALIQTPTALQVNPASAALQVGDTKALQASVLDQDGNPITGASVTWSSSDGSVASVDASGTVKAMKAGSAAITAACGALSGQIPVTVASKPNAAPVFRKTDAQTVDEGESLSFSVSAADENGDVLTYSAAGLPQGAVFDAAAGTFTWTPGYGQAGTYQVTFTASDGSLTGTMEVALTVRDVTAAELTRNLMAAVGGLSSNGGVKALLSANLRLVSSQLNQRQYVLAAVGLRLFAVQVEAFTPWLLGKAESRELLAAAGKALTALGADAKGK